MTHGRLANAQAGGGAADAGLGDQGIEGHQQVQVETAKGGVVDISHVDIIDQVNRFEASLRTD
jgi:hypothetical protein